MFSFFRRSRKDPKETSGGKADGKKEKINWTASTSASLPDESLSYQCPTPTVSSSAILTPTGSNNSPQSVKNSIPPGSAGGKSFDPSVEPKSLIPEKSVSSIPDRSASEKIIPPSIKRTLSPDASAEVKMSIPEEDKPSTPEQSVPISIDLIPAVAEKSILKPVEPVTTKNDNPEASSSLKTLIPEGSTGPAILIPVESTVQKYSILDEAFVPKTPHPDESGEMKMSILDPSVKPELLVPENPSIFDGSVKPKCSAPQKPSISSTPVEQILPIPERTTTENVTPIPIESTEPKIAIPDASGQPAISKADVEALPVSSSGGVSHDRINNPKCGSQSKIRTAESKVKRVHFAPHPHYDTCPPSPPADANIQVDFHRISIQFHCIQSDLINCFISCN